MKIWIKLLLGSFLGIGLGLFYPNVDATIINNFSFLTELFINIGRYAIFPLIFFSLCIGTFKLNQDKQIRKIYSKLFIYISLSTLLLVIIGTLSVLFFSPGRIPIMIEEDITLNIPGIKAVLLSVFPKNLFMIFINKPVFILPIFVLAFVLGLNFSFDRLSTRPAIQVFSALNDIFHHINSFIIEIIGLGVIAISAYLFMQLKLVDLILYKNILLIILIDTILVLLGIYPGILYLLDKNDKPFRRIYAVLGAGIAGFISGDIYFSMSPLFRLTKANLGIHRKASSTSLPFYAIFGRAGSAMITSIAFVILLKSYSSLGVSFFQTLWIMIFSFIVSLSLGPFPGTGAFVGIAMICGFYGKGLEESYLMLKPIAPILISVGAGIDVFTSGLVSYLVSKDLGARKEKDIKEFI